MIKVLLKNTTKDLKKYYSGNQSNTNMYFIEKSARAFVRSFIKKFPKKNRNISIYSGTGNNGAHGLAIGRLLFQKKYYNINIKIIHYSNSYSINFKNNFDLLSNFPIHLKNIKKYQTILEEKSDILIDALLGKELNTPLSNNYIVLIRFLNKLKKIILSIDMPAGCLLGEKINKNAVILKSKKVFSFQNIPINFLLPEYSEYIVKWECLNINFPKIFINSFQTNCYFVEKKDICKFLIKRKNFQNKWDFGHSLIVAGHYPNTIGAALLCASACSHTGSGITSAYIPYESIIAFNIFSPEIIVIPRSKKNFNVNLEKFTVIGIGPGLNIDNFTINLFKFILQKYKKPIVIDANALNIIAKKKSLWNIIPHNSIITPHVKEFDRLFGKHISWFDRLNTIKTQAQKKNIVILLKNRYSIIATPKGKIFFNSTGNPIMAIGGMGDVLTGIIVSLLAQGYSSSKAAIIGAYIHGKSGDDLFYKKSFKIITPKHIITQISKTWSQIT